MILDEVDVPIVGFTFRHMAAAKPAHRIFAALGASMSLVVLAACGTTIPPGASGVSASPAGALNGSSAGDSGISGSQAGATTPAAGPASAGSNGSGSAAGTGSAAGPAGSAGSTQPGSALGGPVNIGVPSHRPSAIRLGVIYLSGLQAAYEAAGAKSSTTDSAADYKAVVSDIDSHGGVDGIPLVASYYAINAESTTPPETQLQAACAFFTQDQHVDIVATYTPGGLSDSLLACLRSKGVPAVDGSTGADVSAGALASDPAWWEPGEISLNRLEQLMPGVLSAEHWASGRWGSNARCATVGGPRIGVVTFDGPDWQQAYTQDLVPAFKRAGTPVYDAVFLNVSGTTANQLAEASAGVQNAVLKFSSECIDHVAFVSNVAVDYLFMNVAAQQDYTPRYGLSSLEDPPVIVQNVASPGSQLHGALGYGWSPYSDVDIADFDTAASAPGARCLSVLKAAGDAPADNNSAFLALPSCEGPFFAAAAFGKWLSSPPGTTLVQAVNGLGVSYRSSGAFGATFSAAQHDGADGYRQFAFVDSCTCFRYTTALSPLTGGSP